jgi:hypothetical protein
MGSMLSSSVVWYIVCSSPNQTEDYKIDMSYFPDMHAQLMHTNRD